MEKRSYEWFEKRRKSRALDLAQEQITKALDTVTLLNNAVQSISHGNISEAIPKIENLFKEEEEARRFCIQRGICVLFNKMTLWTDCRPFHSFHRPAATPSAPADSSDTFLHHARIAAQRCHRVLCFPAERRNESLDLPAMSAGLLLKRPQKVI